MKKNKLNNLIWIIFFCIGVVNIILGLIIYSTIFNIPNKVETKGYITRIYSNNNRNGEIYVSYIVDEKEYENKINGYSSTFYVGKELDIYYDKNNPNRVGVKSLDMLFLLFPGIGLIFLIIGGIGIFVNLNKRRLNNRLKANGKLVYANYVNTILNTSVSINGRNPYKIICEWTNPEDNKKYTFKSDNIWVNPEITINYGNIQLPVYVNLKNCKQYYVDISSITKDIEDLN